MSETGRPGRYTRSANGLVGAMLILLVAVIALGLFRDAFRNEPEYTPPDTDYLEVVSAVQGADGEIVYPAALPEGWVVNNVDFEPGDPPSFSLALLTDDETFAGFLEEADDVDVLVEAFVDESAVEGDPFVLDETSAVAEEWRTFTDDGGDTAYLAEIGTGDAARVVMVYGSADPEDLEALLASLTTAPLT